MDWKGYKNKHTLRVEVVLPNATRVQVFSAHLAIVFASPELRHTEFEFLMSKRNQEIPTIVCGDFNILELPHITLLNWLGGGSLLTWLCWWKDRQAFKKMFLKYSLENPLKGTITQHIALSQLDHVLVSKDFNVIEAKVLQDKMGSDHNPVMVEVESI